MKAIPDQTEQEQVLFEGHAWLDGQCLGPRTAGPLFAGLDFEQFVTRVSACNGLFRVIVRRCGEILAAVDRVRSMPLFWTDAPGGACVGSDAYWVRRQAGDHQPDPAAWAQLWHLLYVLGERTLSPNVRQLTAGCALQMKVSGSAAMSQRRCYYNYIQRPREDSPDPAALMDELDLLLESAVRRVLESSEGRQIVVPLSGGLDSRLIACMLKRLGARRVLCFSYGLPDNVESRQSRAVAQRLGLDWEFICYRDLPREVLDREHRRAFVRFGSNLHTLAPLLEDYLAVQMLRQRGLVEEGAVFCPGHTACFSSSPGALQAAQRSRDDSQLAELILRLHSPRLHWKSPPKAVRQELVDAVERGLRRLGGQADEGRDPAAVLESWNWVERQSKRIVNMARVYEYWGCSWRIPLWDGELMDFWGSLPARLRLGKRLYRQYLASRSRSRLFGLYDHLSERGGLASRAGDLARRATMRVSLGRYFASEDDLERLLCGGYWGYLGCVGRRALSTQPVTAPWLLLEQGALEEIWSADAGEAVGRELSTAMDPKGRA